MPTTANSYHVLYSSILILLLSTSNNVLEAFLYSPATALLPTRAAGSSSTRHPNINHSSTKLPVEPGKLPSRRRSTAAAATSSFTALKSTRETSNELLVLLRSKASAKTDKTSTLDDQIDGLVRSLVSSQTPFDPDRSIYGPFYATLHFIGETPLWEKIGLFGARNVKGQKFTLDDSTETKEESSASFANYAEILGENLYLKAIGTCKGIGPVGRQSAVVSSPPKASNLFDNLSSLLFQSGDNDIGNNKNNNKRKLLPTPYDYEARVTGASVVFFGKFSIDLAIEGTGTVRVLYADENLRIFVSPGDTEVTRGGGDWERGGLIVVQVRVDLVLDDWVDCL